MDTVHHPGPSRTGARATFTCPVCDRERPRSSSVHIEMMHGPTLELLEQDHPQAIHAGVICRSCLNQYRAAYVERVLQEDRGDLTALEADVVSSLREHELLSRNINAQFDEKMTTGERIADRVAAFGGSWRFIILFGCILAGWITINAVQILGRPFDPFPFILLNLALSCLAAVQAPFIMMSQNRQESKDRLRAEHDYQVNLKAELEIRHLHSKIDQLLSRQWRRLLEIQRIQTELLEEISRPERG